MAVKLLDQQSAMEFAIRQASRINGTVYRAKFPQIRYPGLIPVNTEGPEFIQSVTYTSMSGAGQAEWMNVGADDVPKSALQFDKEEVTVRSAAMGYDWNLEELSYASMLGINLPAEKALISRRAAEEMLDRVAFVGDPAVGFTGLVNNGDVTAGTVEQGAGGDTEWEEKTPSEILRDFNDMSGAALDETFGEGRMDTFLVPPSRLRYLATTPVGAEGGDSILQWLLKANLYTLETGQPLTIRAVRGLETAGAGSTARMVAYRRSPEVLELMLPMPFRFHGVWQTGPFRFDVPGLFRTGGTNIKLPAEVRYGDGI